MKEVECSNCSKPLRRFERDIKRCKNFFCDKSCSNEWRKKNLTTTNNYNWRGGRYISKTSGYVYIYVPGHPRQNNWGYVAEHIYVVEKKYNISTKGKHVHHLNGIRDDNRVENLVVVEPKNHEGNTFKKILQKKIREMEQTILYLQNKVSDNGFNHREQ